MIQEEQSMFSRRSSNITEALCKSYVIEEADRELYAAGFFAMILFFLIPIPLGLLFVTLWWRIIFILCSRFFTVVWVDSILLETEYKPLCNIERLHLRRKDNLKVCIDCSTPICWYGV